MADLNQELPGGMELVWVTDDGTFIKATVDSAWINVGQGILLTALILFLFLYNFRSLLVICITMPLTIVIGLFLMHFLEFTLNTTTLLAMGMSVGILVTNSIVVVTHSPRLPLNSTYDTLNLIKEHRHGDSCISIYKKEDRP